MPGKDLGGGLSDFNLTADNDSTSIGDGAGLNQLLQMLDGLGRGQIEERQRAANLSEKLGNVDSLLDRLKTPKGLAMLAATLGLGAAAGPGAAAGFAGGAVGGLQGEEAAETAAIKKELEKSEVRIEKMQQKFATAFNTNPEQFIDPETGQPVLDARVLGWFMTGDTIPMYPQTRRLLNQRNERWKARMDVLTDALGAATTKSDARNLTGAVLREMQWFDPPTEVVDSMVNAMGSDDFDNAFAATLIRHGGQTGIDALIAAGEQGLPPYHPEILRGVKFRTESSITPSQELNQEFINQIKTVNDFSTSPINAEFMRNVRATNEPEEVTRLVAEQALKNQGQASIDTYTKRVGAMGTDEFGRLMQAYSIGNSKRKLVDTVRGAQSLRETLNMSDEEYEAFQMRDAQETVEDAKDAALQSAGNQLASQRNDIATTINDSLRLGPQGTYKLVDLVIEAALKNATKPDGSIDRAKFDQLVAQYTKSAIEQNKE